MSSGKGRVILLVVCLVVYLSLCLLLAGHMMRPLDRKITVAFQAGANRTLDYISLAFTFLGCIEVTTLVVLALCGWLWKHAQIHAALVLLLLFVIGNAVEIAFKQRLEARPPDLEFIRHVFGIPLIVIRTRYSFPSGHLWRTSFLALTLGSFLHNKLYKLPLFIPLAFILYILGMLYTRVYLGEHWFSDAIGGMALGGILFPFVQNAAFQTQRRT
jgi:undecaprenyl-diphosphatase